MRSLWIFRTNLRPLEYYHDFKTLDEFNNGCHDFYLMMAMYYLENDDFDEVIIWRLIPKNRSYTNIPSFTLKNGKRFRQEFVNSFEDIFKYQTIICPPTFSFFRGGFPEYCQLTKKYSNQLGKTLYLAAGKRTIPEYGGIYDKILVESDHDLKKYPGSIPFYKTCNPNVFYMKNREPIYDICFIANFTQKSYKGQKFFIKNVAKSEFLKSLKIVHCGNKPEIGEKLCKQLGVTNIQFDGYKSRTMLRQIINKSKIGIICSNETDGCPRVITEILCCGVPLLIRDKTRLLNFYKEKAVIEYDESNLDNIIRYSRLLYKGLIDESIQNLDRLTMKNICNKNLNLWKK